MRCVVQVVKSASVNIEKECVGKIAYGIVVFVGMGKEDDEKTFDYMSSKIINLRVFPDKGNKMNLSAADLGAEILLVPNFTIYGDARHGRRPSYTAGAGPEQARVIFANFVSYVKKQYNGNVESGVFQAHMQVEVINDGPVTLLIDSDKNF